MSIIKCSTSSAKHMKSLVILQKPVISSTRCYSTKYLEPLWQSFSRGSKTGFSRSSSKWYFSNSSNQGTPEILLTKADWARHSQKLWLRPAPAAPPCSLPALPSGGARCSTAREEELAGRWRLQGHGLRGRGGRAGGGVDGACKRRHWGTGRSRAGERARGGRRRVTPGVRVYPIVRVG
jgi:hypothetical protein